MTNTIQLTDALAMTLAAPHLTYSLTGNPGVGKTFQTAAELRAAGYNVTIVACQNMPIEDTGCLPVVNPDRTVSYLPNEMWRPTSNAKSAFILDELAKAPEDVFNAFNGMLYGKPRSFSGFQYPEDTIVIVTGNPSEFRAGDRMKPHHINRMVNLSIADPTADNAKQTMLDLGFDPRIISWVGNTPSALCSYDAALQSQPEGELTHYFGYRERAPKTPFCSMRSLEIASSLLKVLPNTPARGIALQGTIGTLAATALSMHCREIGVYVDPRDMASSPTEAIVPTSVFDQRMAALGAASALTADNWKNMATYAKRLHPDVYKGVFGPAVARKKIATTPPLLLNGGFNNFLREALS